MSGSNGREKGAGAAIEKDVRFDECVQLGEGGVVCAVTSLRYVVFCLEIELMVLLPNTTLQTIDSIPRRTGRDFWLLGTFLLTFAMMFASLTI